MDQGTATGIFHIPIYTAKINSLDFDLVMEAIDDTHGWKPNDGYNLISENKFILDHEKLKPLKEELEYHLDRFLTEVIKLKLKFHITQSWVNRNPKGSHHVEHIHRNSVWNSVLFLNYHPTPMTFRDPNPWKDYYDFSNETTSVSWANANIEEVYPERGKMIIFPHYLYHAVGENPIDMERYSLAFNTWFSEEFGSPESLTLTTRGNNV